MGKRHEVESAPPFHRMLASSLHEDSETTEIKHPKEAVEDLTSEVEHLGRQHGKGTKRR